MTDPRRPTADAARSAFTGDPGLADEIAALQGDEAFIDQDGILDPSQMEERRTPTRTELDQADPSPDPTIAHGQAAELDGLAAGGLRVGETDDPEVAAEEGLAWVPPMDPPVVPDQEDPEGLAVGAGRGVDALADPYDQDHRGSSGDEGGELELRVREALRADAATSTMDGIEVRLDGDRATVHGVVQTVDDADRIVEVIERVAGITSVTDATVLAES